MTTASKKTYVKPSFRNGAKARFSPNSFFQCYNPWLVGIPRVPERKSLGHLSFVPLSTVLTSLRSRRMMADVWQERGSVY